MSCIVVGVIYGAISWIAARASLPGPDFPIWSRERGYRGEGAIDRVARPRRPRRPARGPPDRLVGIGYTHGLRVRIDGVAVEQLVGR